jgi:nucleotide-binding universal stress UspA family protein
MDNERSNGGVIAVAVDGSDEFPAQRVVVAFDSSRASESALAWAVREAAARRAELRVLHVCHSALDRESQVVRKQVDLSIDETCDSAGIERSDLTIKFESAYGLTIPSILAAAEDADLLVVGSHDHSALGSMFLGSVSQCLCIYSNCPVVVVHETASDGPCGQPRAGAPGYPGSPLGP